MTLFLLNSAQSQVSKKNLFNLSKYMCPVLHKNWMDTHLLIESQMHTQTAEQDRDR